MGVIGDILNLGLGGANLAYEKRLQDQVFRREDTAVQRRVADLRAAGLSPTLAAGSAANSGAVINTTPPDWGGTTGDKALLAMSMMQMKKNIAKSDSEKQLIDLQRESVQVDKELKALEYAIRTRDFDLIKAAGVRSDIKSGWASDLTNLLGVLGPLIEKFKGGDVLGAAAEAFGFKPSLKGFELPEPGSGEREMLSDAYRSVLGGAKPRTKEEIAADQKRPAGKGRSE